MNCFFAQAKNKNRLLVTMFVSFFSSFFSFDMLFPSFDFNQNYFQLFSSCRNLLLPLTILSLRISVVLCGPLESLLEVILRFLRSTIRGLSLSSLWASCFSLHLPRFRVVFVFLSSLLPFSISRAHSLFLISFFVLSMK